MKDIKHITTGEIIPVEFIGTSGIWLIAKDGYTYDMRYWRQTNG
jgi:hypothetical protein